MNITDTIAPKHLSAVNGLFAKLGILIFLPICLYLLLNLFWQAYQTDSVLQDLKYAPPLSRLAQAEQGSQRVWNWFVIRVAEKPKVVTPSRLDATLTGILGIGDRGFAMISVKGKPTEAFKVGDVVSEGVSLKTLGIDYVVLLHGEREEKLQMKKSNLFKKLSEGEKKAEAKSQQELDEVRVRDWANTLKRDPVKLLRTMRFWLVKVKEHGIGYKIKAVDERGGEVMRSAGLENGDILFVANGKPIIQLASSPANLGNLLKDDKLVIRLLRGGAVKDVTISIKD